MTPWGATSRATYRTNWSIAAFAVPRVIMPPRGRRDRIVVKKISRPNPDETICGTTAFDASHTPRTLTAISSSHSAAGISQNGRICSVEKIAALFTSTSMRPNLFTVAAASALQLASSATSVRTKWPPTSEATARPLSALSSAITTFAPSRAKRCA